MSDPKYPYPAQSYYQGPPVMAPPPQYAAASPQYDAAPPHYAAPPPQYQYAAPPPQYAAPPPQYAAPFPRPGFLEGCLAALRCCCLIGECCDGSSIIPAS